jgi:hypothetical protein
MGADGRNSGEQERKLEGGASEKQQHLPSPATAAKSNDGGIHPAVYIAYANPDLELRGISC